ncbi:CGNR zinc finger protein [Propionibacteriaceae bacterium ES.041]|uniref:CGNR zinc finger domain-containing protein n=1 Tax=Enemella evansiae TaxID=2016499 RepID=UPI000B964F6F|nr:CGNR zinc finger domain-containing protein [Enemella evansiae]OYN94642.1 hypothetical protein CGZ96_17360 [Enemella evansiae]PFG67709.1 CGNR zinc finger protein [Propionibacteriaceae bacterium ES.041]
MHLNPYGEAPVRLATELANDPPRTAIELAERCRDADLVFSQRVRRRDLTAVTDFLENWSAIVDATTERDRAEALNLLLAKHSHHPRLDDHADGWHLHYRPDDVDFAELLTALISVGTALHLTGRGMHRLGRCAATDCERIFADVSRNGRQRYCCTRCNNRAAVRRHRDATRSNGSARSA